MEKFHIFPNFRAGFLLEIERQHDHFRMTCLDAVGVHAHVGILQFTGVVVVQCILQTVAELQFWDQFEEGQVEVAAQSHLQEKVGALQLDVLLVLAREVDHRVHASHDIGAVVVPALCTELQIDGEGDIRVLHVLHLFHGATFLGKISHVVEGQVLGTKMHGGREPQVQVLAQPQVGEHANGESAVPAVSVAEDGLLLRRTVFQRDGLRTDVVEFDVLQVHAYKDAEVQWAQVDVRLVLDLACLGLTDDGQEKQQ